MDAHFTTVYNDRLWLLGGTLTNNYGQLLDTSEVYNKIEDQWHPGPNLPEALAGGCLAILSDR